MVTQTTAGNATLIVDEPEKLGPAVELPAPDAPVRDEVRRAALARFLAERARNKRS